MKCELLQKWPEGIVDSLIKHKQNDPDEWRPNKNNPSDTNAIQYRVIVDEGEDYDEEEVQTSATSMKFTVDTAAAASFVPERIQTATPPLQRTMLPPPDPKPDPRKAEREERQRQAKAEREALKNSPVTKCNKWVHGLSRDIVSCCGYIEELKRPGMSQSIAAEFTDTFSTQRTLLEQLRMDMATVRGTGAAEDLIKKAPGVVEAYHVHVSRWKRVRAALA